jgi:glycerol uptake facilitator-like aquaporin
VEHSTPGDAPITNRFGMATGQNDLISRPCTAITHRQSDAQQHGYRSSRRHFAIERTGDDSGRQDRLHLGGYVAAPMSTGPQVAVEYAVEAAGTFVLVFTVGSPAAGSNPWAPLAIGALLRAMVDVGGHLLGGHNPAVTLAVLIGHQVGLRDAAAYWLGQLGAGLLAAAVVARAVVDPAQLAAVATMSLTGRSLMAAFAADVAALVAEPSHKRAGV